MSTIVYYQLNIDTIIEKFCVNKDKPQLKCNGKCYLISKISNIDTVDNNPKKISIKEVFFPLYFHVESVKKQVLDFKYVRTIKIWSIKLFVLYEILYPIDHPPQ